MIATLCIISLVYFMVVFYLIRGIRTLKRFEYESENKSLEETKFSIIISFRNEAQNLPNLLKHLSKIEYPTTHFELLFINDSSEDNSVSIIEKYIETSPFQIQLFDNQPYSKAPKKDAITLGIKKATHRWIVTTDADCEVPSGWLAALNTFIKREHPHLVAMPVLLKKTTPLVGLYQYFETLVLQGITLAGFGLSKPFLCNGANLAYQKDIFFEVNGYEGNNHLASGDDVFLLEKVKKLPDVRLTYLNSPQTLVRTQPEMNWKHVCNQRIRWASKTKKQKSQIAQWLGLLIFLSNLSFIMSVALIFFYPFQVMVWFFFIFYKWIMDILLLNFSAQAFQEDFEASDFIIPSFIQPFLNSWIVLNSLWGNYSWKGRAHRK